MNNFEFISYEPTPSIDNQKGVVTILCNVPTIQRFKIVTKKDGGTFLTTGDLKGEPTDGQNNWLKCSELDRNSHKAELDTFIRSELKKLMPQPQSTSNAYTDRGKGVQKPQDDERLPF